MKNGQRPLDLMPRRPRGRECRAVVWLSSSDFRVSSATWGDGRRTSGRTTDVGHHVRWRRRAGLCKLIGKKIQLGFTKEDNSLCTTCVI